MNISLSLKKWLSVYKHFVESAGQSMTVPKHPVQCSYPGVCKMVVQTLSEALGNGFLLEAITYPLMHLSDEVKCAVK